MYCFSKYETKEEKWIKAIPNANLRVKKDTAAFALHLPSYFEEI